MSPLLPASILLIIAPILPAQLLDETELTAQDEGDRITSFLSFPLEPGGLSWVEKSNDLETWSPQAYFWGFNPSDAVSWPLFSVAKPDPVTGVPQTELDPNYEAPTPANLLLEFSSSGLIVNWTSLDDTNPIYEDRARLRYQVNFIADYTNLWAFFPLYAKQFGDFYFVLLGYRSDSGGYSIIPPYNPTLGPKDTEMLAELLQALPSIETELAGSLANGQTPPSSPPPSGEQHAFWRVGLTSASLLDIDDDGRSNQWEIDNGTNWMSADTDLDGLDDGIDPTPLINEALVDPDGANHGDLNFTPAQGGNLLARWDFETIAIENSLGVFPSALAGQEGFRVEDGPTSPPSTWDGDKNPSGIPSRAITLGGGDHLIGSVGQMPFDSLGDGEEFSFSFWVKIDEGLFQPGYQEGTRDSPTDPIQWIDSPGNGPSGLPDSPPVGYSLLTIGEKFGRNSASAPSFAWVLTPHISVSYLPFNGGVWTRGWSDNYDLTLERWEKGTSSLFLQREQLANWRFPTNAGLDDGKWHHVVLTLGRTTPIEAWIDGVKLVRDQFLQPQKFVNFTDNISQNTGYFQFGKLFDNSLPHFLDDETASRHSLPASLDRVRVYNTTLSESQLQRLYNTDIDRDNLLDRNESTNVFWRDLDKDGKRPSLTLQALFGGEAQPDQEYFYSARPFYCDPPDADHDDDGLTSLFEQDVVESDMGNADTDGDFLPDGWEYDFLGVEAVLDSSSATGNNDSDSLTNLQEYQHQTDPLNSDSDGDGADDSTEVTQGSFANDASDGGLPVPPGQKLTLHITAGDHSGSESETYEVHLHKFDPETREELEIIKTIPGQISQTLVPQTFHLPKDASYTVQLKWLNTSNEAQNGEGPDYDYTFEIETSSPDAPPLLQPYNKLCDCIDDLGNLLGVFDDVSSFIQTVQNERVLIPQVKAIKFEDEAGFDDFERDPAFAQLDYPWLMVPAGGEGSNKCKLTGLKTVVVGLETENETTTVTPDQSGAEDPLTLTFSDSGIGGESFAKLEDGQRFLNLAIYPKKTFTLTAHVVTFPNDDIELTDASGNPRIKKNKGLPEQICIKKGGTVFDTTALGGDDDFTESVIPEIHTGPNGICQTTAQGDDLQPIPPGQGKENENFIAAGPNQVINTYPRGDDNISDDGLFIHTGPDGIRDTPAPTKLVPKNVPSAQELEDYLNEIYGKQANIFFEVNMVHVEIDCDIGHHDPNFPDYEDWGVNAVFDFFTDAATRTHEQNALHGGSNSASQFNLYLLPTRCRRHVVLDSGPINAGGVGGFAFELPRIFYVTANSKSKIELLSTSAHEIGHGRFPQANRGLKHPYDVTEGQFGIPDYDKNPLGFPLKTQESDRERLMWPDNTSPPEASLLIKPEWDILHGN